MYLTRKHEVRSFTAPVRAFVGKIPCPVFRRLTWPLAILSVLFLVGCDYRIAKEKNVDVCALALDRVTAAFQETPITEPRQGACSFRATNSNAVQRRIEIMLLTRSSEEPNDLDGVSRIAVAEAEQTYGTPGSNEFGDLAKLALAFGSNPPETLDHVLLAGRGVLMEIHVSGAKLSHDEVVELSRQLWLRVAAYKPR